MVELLVVIGIIAVLIGILLPTLNSARKAARTTACLSNVRQLAVAYTLYANANKGWTVYTSYLNGAPPATEVARSSGIPWLDCLAPYLGTRMTGKQATKFIFCPEAPAGQGYQSAINIGTAKEPYSQPLAAGITVAFAGSYGMNLFAMSGTPYWGGLASGGTAIPGKPSSIPPQISKYFWTKISHGPGNKVPLFFDATWCDVPGSNMNIPLPNTTLVTPPASFTTGGTNNIQRACLNRHTGAVCVSYKDGSASVVRLKELWDLTWNRLSTPQSSKVTGKFPTR